MNELERGLLQALYNCELSREEFAKRFPVDFNSDAIYVCRLVKAGIGSGDLEALNLAICLLFTARHQPEYLHLYNCLLVTPHHYHHQEVARELQALKSPSTIPFARQVLESDFAWLAYTCSDSGAIAKWFSHLLWDIGTPEAEALIREYSHADDEGIRREMLYRLQRMQHSDNR